MIEIEHIKQKDDTGAMLFVKAIILLGLYYILYFVYSII